MRLVRVRDRHTARVVCNGVRRFNGVSISVGRVISRPHFTIVTRGLTAGWIGFEGRGRGVYELVHLSVKPAYRHGGLAQSAVARVLGMVRSGGGRYAYTRINYRNVPSMCLARKMGFRKTHGGSVCVFGRSV